MPLYRASFFCRHPLGQNCVNALALGVVYAGLTTPANDDELAEALYQALKIEYDNFLPGGYEMQGVIASQLPATGFSSGKSLLHTDTTANIGQILPPQVSGLIRLHVAGSSGRRNGRIFVPAASEPESDDPGRPSAAYMALLQTFADNLLAGLAISGGVGPGAWTGTATLKVYSRTGLSTHTPTSANVSPYWATRKSRSGINRGDVPF